MSEPRSTIKELEQREKALLIELADMRIALKVVRKLEKPSAEQAQPVSSAVRTESKSAAVRRLTEEFLDGYKTPRSTSQVRQAVEHHPEVQGFNFNTQLFNVLNRASKSGKSRIAKRGKSWTTTPLELDSRPTDGGMDDGALRITPPSP